MTSRSLRAALLVALTLSAGCDPNPGGPSVKAQPEAPGATAATDTPKKGTGEPPPQGVKAHGQPTPRSMSDLK